MKNLGKIHRILLGGIMCFMLSPCVLAQEEGLVLHYSFENTTGVSVPDMSGSQINGTLKNNAKVEKMGKYSVLNLGAANGYLDLTAKAGELYRKRDTLSLSMYYRVNEETSLQGNGHFLWAFSTQTACSSTSGKYAAYRLNAQRFAVSTGGYNNETGIEIGGEAPKGKWTHVLYVQKGRQASLYVNGVQKGTHATMPINTTNFSTAVSYAWIGRAPFSGDNYLKNTLISDIRLYSKVLNDAEIKTLAAKTESLEQEYRYGTPGDFTSLLRTIASAETFLKGIDPEVYPTLALLEYQDALNMAIMMCKEQKAAQSILDECEENLKSAQTRLKKVENFVLDTLGSDSKYDTNKGFRHPGGLHTEADFIRIKQQLKEGNSKVVAAYNELKNAAYSQSDVVTWPVEVIVRGGGVGENYINAARGATMAYQNALRWKIDGTEAHARNAITILMKWARTTKSIGGDSNYALAAGLYGYQFAQAAELMRDYKGWAAEDFQEFKQWMLKVWYPSCIGFLRGRNGTWANTSGQGGIRPGHYWSNWGLCNALAVMSIGVLCDDVFLYNQGVSFYKYDQVGTFKAIRGASIDNDGLTEFLGNLVVTVADDVRGPFGKLGQMQESGRDQGHATMAAGLAVDMCQVAWNQGDDMYSHMDNRLAAGLEYIAAYNNNGVDDLPWTTYRYADCRTAWHNAWVQEGNNAGGRGQTRAYWARVIGHYEGIKGVKMKYSEKALTDMGIDAGGTGGTSGAYDHLGYSVLTCTQKGMVEPDEVPTKLMPIIQYNGKVVAQAELGGLKHGFEVAPTSSLPSGTLLTLMPQLPEGEENTGKWEWNTGESTQNITIAADQSYMYRVVYTNAKGVKSQQTFSIAVAGDCEQTTIQPSITVNGTTIQGDSIDVLWGSEVTLSVSDVGGWGRYLWENGLEGSTITLSNVTSSREVSVVFENQGGKKTICTFHINVRTYNTNILVDDEMRENVSEVVVEQDSKVELIPVVPDALSSGTWKWSNGAATKTLQLDKIQTSGEYTVEYSFGGEKLFEHTFSVWLHGEDKLVEEGDYMILHIPTGRYMAHTGTAVPSFCLLNTSEPEQFVWRISHSNSALHSIMSVLDSTYVSLNGTLRKTDLNRLFRIAQIVGTNKCCIYRGSSTPSYWQVQEDGSITFSGVNTLYGFPFELVPYSTTGIEFPNMVFDKRKVSYVRFLTMDGRVIEHPRRGIILRYTKYDDGEELIEKILIR